MSGNMITANYDSEGKQSFDPSQNPAARNIVISEFDPVTGVIEIIDTSGAKSSPIRAAPVADVFDVLIHGGDTGSIICGCELAKRGWSVVVVTQKRIGGMVTGGLSRTDHYGVNPYVTMSPAALDFYRRIASKYSKTLEQLSFSGASPLAHEPKVALEVLREMIRESGLKVVTGLRPKTVTKSRGAIVAVEFETLNGASTRTFRARYFADGSITPDLMIKTPGVTWTYGRDGNAKYTETNNGVRAGQNILAGVSPYLVAGDSGSGLLPQVDTNALETAGTADGRLQSPGIRLCVTNDASIRKSFPTPIDYDPAEFEYNRRVFAASPTSYDTISEVFTAASIPSAPKVKWDWNNRGAASTDVIDKRIVFDNGDYAARASMEALIYKRTINFLYFLRTDAAVPAALKTALADYGFCADEFVDDNSLGMAPEIYWRDHARLSKRNTIDVVREQNVLRTATVENPVAFATYGADSHHRSLRDIGGVLMPEGGMSIHTNGYYGIPMACMLPDRGQADNLIVMHSGCVAASSVGQQSLRMEETAISLGHVASVMIDAALSGHSSLQDLAASDIAKATVPAIVNPARVLTLAAPSTNGTATTSSVAGWTQNITATPPGIPDYYGATGYWDEMGSNKGGRWAKFVPNITEAGYYRVRANLPQTTADQPSIKVTVNHVGGLEEFYVDFKYGGWFWRDLGVFQFAADGSGYVTFTNGVKPGDTATGKMSVDGITWDKV